MSLFKKPTSKHQVSGEHSSVITTAGLEIDLEARSVTHKANPVVIKGLTFDMLVELLKADNQVVSVEQLAEKVWKGKIVSDETIAQRISLLRKALPEFSDGYIESVRSEGYRWLPSIQSHAISSEQKAINRKRGITAVAVVFIAGVIYWAIQQQPEDKVITNPEDFVEYGLDVNVFTRVKLARAEQYASAKTSSSNTIAIELYRDLLETELNSPEVIFGLVNALLLDIAKYGANNVKLTEADTLSQTLLQEFPNNARYLWLRGFYYQVLGNLTKAIEFYELGLAQAPSDAQIGLDLANLYAQKGRLVDALELSIRQFDLGERFQLSQIANVLFLTGQNEEALEWLSAAVQLAPDDSEASAKLAEFLLFNGDYEQAKLVIDNLHDRARGGVKSHLVEFNLSLLANDYEQANTSLLFAERLQPTSFELIAWRAWFESHQQHVPRVSVEQFRLSEDGRPDQYVAKSILALAHKDTETALVMLYRAQRLGFINYQYLLHMPPFQAISDNRLFQEIILTMKDRQTAESKKINQLPIPDLEA